MCHTLRALTDRRQIGVVMKLDGDPDVEHRVQVSVPVMQAETEGVWARRLQFLQWVWRLPITVATDQPP